MRDEQHFDVYRDVSERDPADARSARGRALRAALAAVVSLAVTGTVVVWAYRLGVRDAYEVPVVRAIEGPSKIRPDEPGGARFAHQGRAVYDAVSGAPADAAAGVTLAPGPEALTEEDAPMALAGSPAPTPVPPAAAAPVDPVVVAPLDATAEEVDQLVAAVLSDSPETGSAPLAAEASSRSAAPAPRPRERVAALEPQTPAAAPPSAAPPAAAPPAATPAGPQVQLGAYLSEADALRFWTGIRARNGDLLAGRQPSVAPLVGTNRTLYRLRAEPFADVAEARALCAALRERREDCLIPGPD